MHQQRDSQKANQGLGLTVFGTLRVALVVAPSAKTAGGGVESSERLYWISKKKKLGRTLDTGCGIKEPDPGRIRKLGF